MAPDPPGRDSPPPVDSWRTAPAKSRGGRQLGLKRKPAPGQPLPPGAPPSEAAISTSAAPNSSPGAPFSSHVAPASSTGTPASSGVAPGSDPAAAASSCTAPTWTGPVRPLQGQGLGAVPPNLTNFPGNQQVPNSWFFPPGGFLPMLHKPVHLQGENFHLVGQNMPFNPVSPQQPASSHGTPPQATEQPTEQGTEQAMEQDTAANKNVKARNLRYWTHEEEERLASAWLEISKDPIHGNDKKGDSFWKEITSEFNRKGNGKRTRESNQLKVHWSRLKTTIGDWNDYWTKVCQMHTSGYSDDMLEEEAQKMYANKNGKKFTLIHWWKILKDEPKWCAQFVTEKDKKDNGDIVDIPDAQIRPEGREAAKAERRGKRKKENVKDGIVMLGDNIEKIIKIEEDRKMERDKVTEAQVQISNTNLQAAIVQKEAKMFEVYNSLLQQDTTNMSETAKASRDKAIRKMEEKLFAD